MAKRSQLTVLGKFFVAVNGHTLRGVKQRGSWQFTCPDWPALESAKDPDEAIAEFMAMASMIPEKRTPPSKEGS